MRATNIASRFLGAIAVMLFASLLWQVVTISRAPPLVHGMASWAHVARNLADANALASQIVIANVARVDAAPDLQARVRGEPGGVDRVPIEIVTLNVERVIKGPSQNQLRLFHTALTRVGQTPAPLSSDASRAPPAPYDEPEQRTSFLEDDPNYVPGQRYLLFLMNGPVVAGLPTVAVIAPEGRYIVTPNNTLRSLTTRGMAPPLNGQPVTSVFPPTPSPSPSPTRSPAPRHRNTILTDIGAALGAYLIARSLGGSNGGGDAPTGLGETPAGSDREGATVILHWQPARGTTPQSYLVTFQREAGPAQQTQTRETSLTVRIGNVPQRTEFTWSVRAQRAQGGYSAPSTHRFAVNPR